MTPVLMSWSGGKDCCMALRQLQQSALYRVEALLSTVAREDGRLGMNGVSSALIEAQAQSLNLALHKIPVPSGANNAAYEEALAGAFAVQRENGCHTVAFGDLFLEDIREYRDAFLGRHGMTALYPIWGRATRTLLQDFIGAGFKAVICSVDLARLDMSFVGREIDATLLRDLPSTVDPCGENGEFHTFVYGGPNFDHSINISLGAPEVRDGLGFREPNLVASGAGAVAID